VFTPVPGVGFEPTRSKGSEGFKPSASASCATRAVVGHGTPRPGAAYPPSRLPPGTPPLRAAARPRLVASKRPRGKEWEWNDVEVFGDPSDELLEAAAAFEPKIYSFFQGK